MQEHEARVQYALDKLIELKNCLCRDMLISDIKGMIVLMDACTRYAGMVLAKLRSRFTP